MGRYLPARRAHPADVGLPVCHGRRRTPGLRREELAMLVGISSDYYVRLERRRETRPSPAVIDALATALQLTEDEREHLRSLRVRRPANPQTRYRLPRAWVHHIQRLVLLGNLAGASPQQTAPVLGRY
jgi:transcriptional regulator with XRE-family HTH domain